MKPPFGLASVVFFIGGLFGAALVTDQYAAAALLGIAAALFLAAIGLRK